MGPSPSPEKDEGFPFVEASLEKVIRKIYDFNKSIVFDYIEGSTPYF